MSRVLAPILLVILGVGLLAHPLYLSLPSGEKLHPTFEETKASACYATIDYRDLPPRARHSFDITSHGDMPHFNDTLYSGQHTAAVEAFRQHDCIREDGTHYDVYLIHMDGPELHPPKLITPALYGVGSLALIGAAVRLLRDRSAE